MPDTETSRMRREADKRRRLREADEAKAHVLFGRAGERVQVTTWVDGYYWTCQVCGWLGKGNTSNTDAYTAASLHLSAHHPELTHARFVNKDTDG